MTCRESRSRFPAAPRLTWSVAPSSCAKLLLPLRHARRHFAPCTSAIHITAQPTGTRALREPPHQNEDNSNPRELFDSRLTACHNPQNKASARALCSPYSTAKAGSIATAHRLKHAWLASHHRAPSSQQSKSSINSVAVAIKYQVAIHLQIAVVARLVVLQKQSARPSRARFATGLAGWDQYWRLESALDFSAPLAEHHRFITTRH